MQDLIPGSNYVDIHDKHTNKLALSTKLWYIFLIKGLSFVNYVYKPFFRPASGNTHVRDIDGYLSNDF